MAVQSRDPMLRVTGHHAVGYTHFCRGDYAEALAHADDGLALFDRDREQSIASMFQLSSSCALWWFRSQAQFVLGHMRTSSESLNRAHALVEELRHVPSRAYLLSQRCLSFHARDDVQQVEELARALRALSVAEGFALWVPFADTFLAWARARQGDPAAAAVEQIQTATNSVHGSLTHILDIEFAAMLGETLILAGRADEVFRVAEAALAVTRLGKARHYEPELFRIQGEAARALGDMNRATTLFHKGVATARSMNARLLELRSLLALARITGRDEERGELKTVLDGFDDELDHADLEKVSAFLTAKGPGETRAHSRL